MKPSMSMFLPTMSIIKLCPNSGVVGNWGHERQGTANIRSCGDTGN